MMKYPIGDLVEQIKTGKIWEVVAAYPSRQTLIVKDPSDKKNRSCLLLEHEITSYVERIKS